MDAFAPRLARTRPLQWPGRHVQAHQRVLVGPAPVQQDARRCVCVCVYVRVCVCVYVCVCVVMSSRPACSVSLWLLLSLFRTASVSLSSSRTQLLLSIYKSLPTATPWPAQSKPYISTRTISLHRPALPSPAPHPHPAHPPNPTPRARRSTRTLRSCKATRPPAGRCSGSPP